MMKRTRLQRARYQVPHPEQQPVQLRRQPLPPAIQAARLTKRTSRPREKTIQATSSPLLTLRVFPEHWPKPASPSSTFPNELHTPQLVREPLALTRRSCRRTYRAAADATRARSGRTSEMPGHMHRARACRCAQPLQGHGKSLRTPLARSRPAAAPRLGQRASGNAEYPAEQQRSPQGRLEPSPRRPERHAPLYEAVLVLSLMDVKRLSISGGTSSKRENAPFVVDAEARTMMVAPANSSRSAPVCVGRESIHWRPTLRHQGGAVAVEG